MLNAVLFQPVSHSSYHIYCKFITETIPEQPYNQWNGTRFLFPNKSLFPDKLSNFGGKTLLATSFQLAPFTYRNADGTRGGWEYSVMAALAEKLNFKLDINPPPNGELWGENKNGTFTGPNILNRISYVLPNFCQKVLLVSYKERSQILDLQTCSWCQTGWNILTTLTHTQ